MLLRRPTRALATKSCAALALFVATALVVGLGVPVAAARAAWAQAHTLSVSDVTVAEGDSGTVNAEFTVTLSSASTSLVSVDYVTANGTATAGSDYVATTGSLTFTPGQTTRKVPVPVAGDRLDEVNETFTLNLSNAFGATISDGQGVATITDNDPPPSLRVSDANPNPVRESPLLPTLPDNTVTFTVALSGASGKTVTATYATGGGTATAESDYTSATGTLSFAPGETSKTVTVTVLPDAVDEPDETFDLTVSAATEATVADASGRATIADDDGPPALSVADATVVEGDAGTTNAAFTVTLAPASGKTVTVRYATSNGTAAAPGDYATATGTLTFAPGETSKIVTVPVVGDSADEADETFTVTLSGATEALITDATGTGTITDDDAGSTLSIGDVSRLENAGGATTTFSLPVTLSRPSGQPVTVDLATADGTPKSHRD